MVLAQERIKLQANTNRSERSFSVGDWVFLRLQPYSHKTLSHKTLGKLAPKCYGPFQVMQKIGEVAYKLDIPTGTTVHSVFYVSCLKANLGQKVIPIPTLLARTVEGVINPKPVASLPQRLHQLRNRVITQVLVQWQREVVMMLLGKVCTISNTNLGQNALREGGFLRR